MNGSNRNALLYDEDVFRLFGVRPSCNTPYSDITHAAGKPRKKVKRPMNSFMAFSFFERKKICLENPKIHNAEVSRKLGDLWKRTCVDQKRLFEKIAKILKIYHEIEFPDYKYKPKKKQKLPPVPQELVTRKKPAPRKTRQRKFDQEKLVIRPSSVSVVNDPQGSNGNECTARMDVTIVSNLPEQKVTPPDSLLTPPSSAPMTPESMIDEPVPIFPPAVNISQAIASAATSLEVPAISVPNSFFDMMSSTEGSSNFMDQYESENSSSSLTFSSSPAEFQPFTDNQLMQFNPLTDEDLLQ